MKVESLNLIILSDSFDAGLAANVLKKLKEGKSVQVIKMGCVLFKTRCSDVTKGLLQTNQLQKHYNVTDDKQALFQVFLFWCVSP